jgi:hypothetical protein
VVKAFAKAGNVAWEDIKTIDKPLTFEFTPDGSEITYTIKTTPTARPGRKPASTVPAETSTVEGDNSAETGTDSSENSAAASA